MCIGSSCHLKGSYEVIQLLNERIAKEGLEKQIQVKGSFCLGNCADGVSIKVDDTLVSGIRADNFDSKFNEYVLGALSK